MSFNRIDAYKLFNGFLQFFLGSLDGLLFSNNMNQFLIFIIFRWENDTSSRVVANLQ